MGSSAKDATDALDAEFHALRNAADNEFPLDDAATPALFAEMRAELEEIYAAEVAANQALRVAIGAWQPVHHFHRRETIPAQIWGRIEWAAVSSQIRAPGWRFACSACVESVCSLTKTSMAAKTRSSPSTWHS